MGDADSRREALAARIAEELLADGVAVLPLRELAGRLDTSDRMLLYYFDSQSELLRAALHCLSDRLARQLEDLGAGARVSPPRLLQDLTHRMAKPDFARIMRVWGDITTRGTRGEEPFAAFARASVEQWHTWIDSRLNVTDDAARADFASAILVIVDGARLLEATSPGSTDRAVRLLVSRLESGGATLA